MFLLLLSLQGALWSQQQPRPPSSPGVPRPNADTLQSATVFLREAIGRIGLGQYEAAEQELGGYLLRYPNHYRVPEANFYRAIVDYHLGRLDEGRTKLNALITSQPQQARRFGAFYWLGLISYELGQEDTAYDLWLRQLAVTEPEAASYIQQAYFGLARYLTKQGEEEQALAYFRRLKGRVSRLAGFAHGTLALNQGLYHEAYNAFSAYLAQGEIGSGPSRAQALFYQGQSAFFAGLYDRAKLSLDTVLRLYNSSERLFQAALIMRLRIALKEQDTPNASRFYEEAVALEQRYRHGFKDWLNTCELPLFLQEGRYALAMRHMRAKLARSRGRTEREISRFNLALVRALVDARYAMRNFKKLESSFIPGIRERSMFHRARLEVSFPLTRADGLPRMELYLEQYPEGLYAKEAGRILLEVYRSDPERYWLQSSVLLQHLVDSPIWAKREKARFYLYWAEMARQLRNDNGSLNYLNQSWRLAPKDLIGLEAYYRSGAIYFAQKQYSRALGYFREVQLQLNGMRFVSSYAKNDADTLAFYAELGIAQAYAGAGQNRQALQNFQKLIDSTRNDRLGRTAQQARLQLGLVYFYQRAYERAVDTFDLIVGQGIYPSNQGDFEPNAYTPALMALYWKGEALFRQGLYAASRQSFRRANELFPEALGPNAYIRAALAAKAGEDYVSVVEDLEQAQQFLAGNLLQLLNVDFNLVKYNLLLGRDSAAIEEATHMLDAVPPAYNFLGEAFMEVAELYFNRGELERSKEVLDLLIKEFLRKLPPRERRERRRLELYLEEQQQGLPPVAGMMTDTALNENLRDNLFSFNSEEFLRRYSRNQDVALPVNYGTNIAALDSNLGFYTQGGEDSVEDEITSSSIFSALYLQGLVHSEQEDYLAACKYFLQYLKKDPLGSYAISAVSAILRLMPELNTRYNRQLYGILRAARLGDALDSVLLVRYWSLQADRGPKRRNLERIARQTLSINAKKEAMFHLSEYYRKRGDEEKARQLLVDLSVVKGGNLALDPENYWAAQANLRLGRTAYRQERYGDAENYFLAILQQAQVEKESLAEALFWLASIAHFEGDLQKRERYRKSLQELAPNSEWLRKLN